MKFRTLPLLAGFAAIFCFPALSRGFTPGLGFPEGNGSPYSLEASLGAGLLGGDTLYQIGGHYDSADGSGTLQFPLSELRFPLSSATATAGVTFGFLDDFSARFMVTKNLSGDAGKMEDSDWGAYYLSYGPPYAHDSLDIYSESDAELTALMLRADILYRLFRNRWLSVGAGLGYRYQKFSCDVKNLDQWYPSSDYYLGYDLDHDYQDGLVLTYEVTYHIPSLEAALAATPLPGLSLTAAIGVSPLVFADDRDDHLLRSKLSTGDCTGWAVMMDTAARYQILSWLYAELGVELVVIRTDGTQRQTFYATTDEATAGDTATIDQKIESTQYSVNLGLGVRF